MENKEIISNEPQSVKEAATRFLEGDTDATVAYLRMNKDDVGEFCLQVRERYDSNDAKTPILRLAELIEFLL